MMKETKPVQPLPMCVSLDPNTLLECEKLVLPHVLLTLKKAETVKQVEYIKVISHMQNFSNGYTFSIIVVVFGAMGAIPKILVKNLQKISYR